MPCDTRWVNTLAVAGVGQEVQTPTAA